MAETRKLFATDYGADEWLIFDTLAKAFVSLSFTGYTTAAAFSVEDMCNLIQAFAVDNKDKKIDHFVFLDHGYQNHRLSEAKQSIKMDLAIGDEYVNSSNFAIYGPYFRKAGNYITQGGSVTFLNCDIGLDEELMKKLGKSFGCTVRGSRQSENFLTINAPDWTECEYTYAHSDGTITRN